MITKLLNEVNEKIETLNNLVQNTEYFEKLDERIEKVNNYGQEQKQENERLHSIIKEAREYIQKNLTEDDNGCGCWWYSFEYYVNAKKELLKILDEEAHNDKRRNSKNSS